MLLVSTAAAAAPAGAAGPAPNPLTSLIPFVLIFVVFYFLIIRPQQNARKKHQAMVEAVKRGDTVVTAGGLVGKVTKVSEGPEISVRLADNVEVQVIKSTLTDVRAKGEPANDDAKAKA
ncbi:preprotein translocase subunit YajC [Parvularcula sp. ZS-1/3]|uniref:Sec translocon accessory complex subunit YajC n=2 Tax=Parvularcula mediterranea TaxID=2732508 RepID=A0A7Y3RJV3_9PROT|nr:preprotein translocase subunit YajC [Parvularcula mediterranea]